MVFLYSREASKGPGGFEGLDVLSMAIGFSSVPGTLVISGLSSLGIW